MDFNIDAKINGACIVMGLLYGNRDLDQTTIISCRCGHDSDCNPSSAAGILFTTIGMESSTRSYVVKRFPQDSHWRLRRVLSPSSDSRESMTAVSSALQ
jgi:hypothetical protein